MANEKYSSRLPYWDANDFETSYNDDDYLGKGGFGAARRCYHDDFGAVVAKCINPSGSKQKIEEIKKSVADEANVLSRCEHANIIKVLGYTKWAKNIAIIMEYADGGNLHDLCENVSDFPWCIRLQIAQQTSSALCYLHYNDPKKAIVHGDLKPENILLTRALQVKLADFGAASRNVLADAASSSITLPCELAQLSSRYAAPEVLESRSRNQIPKGQPSMDMYSYGGIIFELITQELFDRLQLTKVEEVGQKIVSDQDKSIFEELDNCLEKCLENDPDNRPKSNAVSEQLENVLQTLKEDYVKRSADVVIPLLSATNPSLESQRQTLFDLRYPFEGDCDDDIATFYY